MKSVKLFEVENEFESKKLIKHISQKVENLSDSLKGLYTDKPYKKYPRYI